MIQKKTFQSDLFPFVIGSWAWGAKNEIGNICEAEEKIHQHFESKKNKKTSFSRALIYSTKQKNMSLLTENVSFLTKHLKWCCKVD